MRVWQEVAGDGGGFVRECELAGEVVETADGENGAIGEGEGDNGEGFGSEEGG